MIDLDHSETLATVISEVVTLTVRASRETVWVNKAIRTFCDNILDHVRTFWSIIMIMIMESKDRDILAFSGSNPYKPLPI